MSVVSATAIYFLIWWVTLFAVLPWGVKTQEEEGDVVDGTVSSAPARPELVKKAIATTIISGIIFAILAVGYQNQWVSIEDIPFLPKF